MTKNLLLDDVADAVFISRPVKEQARETPPWSTQVGGSRCPQLGRPVPPKEGASSGSADGQGRWVDGSD